MFVLRSILMTLLAVMFLVVPVWINFIQMAKVNALIGMQQDVDAQDINEMIQGGLHGMQYKNIVAGMTALVSTMPLLRLGERRQL